MKTILSATLSVFLLSGSAMAGSLTRPANQVGASVATSNTVGTHLAALNNDPPATHNFNDHGGVQLSTRVPGVITVPVTATVLDGALGGAGAPNGTLGTVDGTGDGR